MFDCFPDKDKGTIKLEPWITIFYPPPPKPISDILNNNI